VRVEKKQTPHRYAPTNESPHHSAQSNLTNKSRLKILHQREELLQDLFSSARTSVSSLVQNETSYLSFLEGTIVQGALQLMEPIVILSARKHDVPVVSRAALNAASTYNDITGRNVQFSVEPILGDDWCVTASNALLFPPSSEF
jgi:V-type H+-transporting ATPase subunit E